MPKSCLQKDKALAIIGPSITPASMTVLEMTQKAKMPLISCAAAAGITAPAKDRFWTFKTAQTDQMAVEPDLPVLPEARHRQGGHPHRVLRLRGGGQGAIARPRPPSIGIEVVGQEVFGDKDTDMTPQLTKIRSTPGPGGDLLGRRPGPGPGGQEHEAVGPDHPPDPEPRRRLQKVHRTGRRTPAKASSCPPANW